MGTRLPVIKNNVYSEILLRLGVHKAYINEFVEWFDEDFTRGKKKKQPVLFRQMQYLEENGYVKSTSLDDNGKKLNKNKKLFFVNFEKIIEEFIDYSIEKLKKEAIFDKTGKYFDDSIDILNNNEYREKCKKNRIIRYLFSAYFEETRKNNSDKTTIKIVDLFDNIFYSGYLDEKIIERICGVLLDKGVKIKFNVFSIPDLDKYKGYFDKELYNEFLFFQSFLSEIGIHKESYFPQEMFPFEIATKIVNGFDKDDFSYYRL